MNPVREKHRNHELGKILKETELRAKKRNVKIDSATLIRENRHDQSTAQTCAESGHAEVRRILRVFILKKTGEERIRKR
jgi:hypothetical protein